MIDNVDASSLYCCNAEINYQTIKMFAVEKIVNSIMSDWFSHFFAVIVIQWIEKLTNLMTKNARNSILQQLSMSFDELFACVVSNHIIS